MNNTSNQVSPRNRVDFSKIRQISKFAVGGITHVGGDWYNTIFSNFKQLMILELSAATTPEEKLRIVDKYNNQQSNYAQLRPLFTNLSSADYNKAVEDYQNLINTDFNFVNSYGIKNGVNSGRYKKIGNPKRIGKDLADQWTADGYWAGQTQDRTTLGYKGDWDEESDQFKTWQLSLNDLGMETFLDSDNAYKLRLLQNPTPEPEPDPLPEPLPEPEPEPSSQNTPENEDLQDLEFETLPGRLSNPWTDWIPLSGMLGNNLMNNTRVFNDEVKKKFPLQEAPYLQGKVTNNYAARLLRNKQIAEARTRALQQLGSDLVQNQNYLNAVEQRADALENQNAADQTQEFNETTQRLQEIENKNKVSEASTANYNRMQNAAAWNNILAARQKLNTTNTAELNSYIGNMYASHAQWLQNERLEDARHQREMNDYLYQQGLNKLYESSGLKSLEAGIQNSEAFNRFKLNLLANSEITLPLDESGQISDQAIIDYISEHSGDDDVKALTQAYEKEKTDAMSRYENEQTGLLAQRTKANMTIPATFSNQGFRFGDRYIRRSIPQMTWVTPRYKSGGKVRNARFIDYMNHYQKLQQFDRTETRKTQELLQKKVSRELGEIDKETLMLLKLAFS